MKEKWEKKNCNGNTDSNAGYSMRHRQENLLRNGKHVMKLNIVCLPP